MKDNPYLNTVKSKKNVVLLRLVRYILAHKWLVVAAAFLMLTSNILGLIGPSISGRAIDTVAVGKGNVDFAKVFFYCGCMIGFYLVSSILAYLLSLVMIKLSRTIVMKMREDVFEKLSELPVGFFDKIQAGDLISLISYDIDTVNASLSNDLLQVCASVITIVGSFIGMLLISPTLLLVFVVTLPISILVALRRSKTVRPLFKKRSAELGKMNGFIEETISGSKTIKAYNREAQILQRFDEKNAGAVQAYYDADYVSSAMGPSINFINNLSLALISTFGAMLFLFGKISIGNVSSFILYSRRFSGPINEIGNILSELQSAISAADRVFRLIDAPPETPDKRDATDLTDVKGDIEFDHVTFGYDKDTPVIKDFSMQVHQGDLVAIVGHTGAGKTTLVNLLMRFYDVNSGMIRIDGQDISGVTRKSLRSAYTMVLQDTWLFEGSVFDNIAYGKESAKLADVVRVSRAANIHEFIETLPQGYATILNEDGVNLSKGQKQLITIARAMLNDSRILILDEATSNVDTLTEIQIQRAMNKLMSGKTCFVIAHRLSTIQNADRIVVMDNGQVAEQGTHESLLRQNGVYARLYHAQYE